MKIEQKESEFTPIVITLETKKEAEIMRKIMDSYTKIGGSAFISDSYGLALSIYNHIKETL
jgi:hypothetical protein